MKRIMVVILVIVMCLSFTGCMRTVVETTEWKDQVTVLDTNYRGPIMYPVKIGKVQSFRTHPADYDTIVEYEGATYELDSKDAYDVAKNYQNKELNAIIRKDTYDDGTTKMSIVGLFEAE